MLLAIDIGNTNIKYGVFDGEKLKASYRVSSRLNRTADEYGEVLVSLLRNSSIDKTEIDGIIVSSVIPSLNYTICHMCEYFLHIKPLMVGAGVKTGLNVKVKHPTQVGADRIVNSISGFKKYGGPLILIDFGTATTFNVITENADFIGGVIAPGIKSALESLVKSTAQLPMIEIEKPQTVIGKDTETNMQAGIVYGFVGLVEKIVGEIKSELGNDKVKVVATGGLGQMIVKELNCIDAYDRALTLEGLRIIYNLNK